MKAVKSLLPFILLIFILSCDKTTGNQSGISGRVYYQDRVEQAKDAEVYLGLHDPVLLYYTFQQSTYTNSNGFYFFGKPDNHSFVCIYAKKENINNRELSYISPIIDFTINQEVEQINVEDIYLYEVHNNSQIDGIVVSEDEQTAPNCLVKLYRLEDMSYTKTDSIFTDSNGNYQFSNVQTGNYKIYSGHGPMWDKKYFFVNGNNNLNLPLFLSSLHADKPAIYIYPEFDRQFLVNLNMHNRTKLTKSIPEYNSGWDVFVEESGKIEHKYDYLFYETSIMELSRFFSGWCFKKEEMEKGLKGVLNKIGLNEKETAEFLEYWLPRFGKFDYYKVYYLLNKQLDHYVGLDISPLPDSELRTLFFFEGCNQFENLPEPQVPEFKRAGTTVVEWGGVLMN